MKVKTVTVRQIQNLDKIAINKYGIPSLALMENAGRAVASRIISRLKGIKKAKAVIIAGLGNNAGDGFVIARHLINARIDTSVILIGRASRLKADAKTNYAILKKLKYPVKEVVKLTPSVVKMIASANIVVDAVFGVGLNRDIKDPFKSFIGAVNTEGKFVISVDTPSGLDGTTGKVYGVCVRANETVTFTFSKKGFLKNEGPKHTGRVTVVDIGIPLKLQSKI